jgi:putative ABC transport system ATP-binding protein
MDAICEFRNVTKGYGKRAVVRNLSFSIRKGEMVAITGPSGSGKSTVLNLIGLLESPDDGSIRLFGRDVPRIKSRPAERLLRERIGYLFQNYALIDGENVDYNLKVAQQYVRAPAKAKEAARTGVIQRVGLPATASGQKVYELSGGEQQRVAIARLLLKPCDLVLADEPTGSLDAANRDQVLGRLEDMNAAGKTIVIVTHDPAVAATCTRTIDLSHLVLAS